MSTENRTDKSAPLVLATRLLSVCGDSFHHGDDPEHASLEDVAAVVRSAREYLQSALDDGFESKTCDIFKAIDVMRLAEAYLLTHTKSHESPIRSALQLAVELIERELESGGGEPPAPAEGDNSGAGRGVTGRIAGSPTS